jgi:membrane-associated protease RseP (regulator of RpoE activity)
MHRALTFFSRSLALSGVAVLSLYGSAAAQEEKEASAGRKVIVLAEDGEDHVRLPPGAERLNEDLDCREENGKKICIARFGLPGTFLGVGLTETTPELNEHLGAPRQAGVLVSRIESESPAADAGLKVGDIISAIDGEAIESPQELRHAITTRDAGDTVTVDVYRDGRSEQFTATLAKRESKFFNQRVPPPGWLDVEELSEQIHQALEDIDLEDLDAEVRKQLDSVDWEKIRDAVRKALDRALEERER